MPFITFSAIASTNAISIGKEMKPYLEEIDYKAEQALDGAYENIVNYGKLHPSKSDVKINHVKFKPV